MQPAKKIAQEQILRNLVPFNALSEERFNELAGKIEIVEVKSGRYLFRKGERDNQSVYLLSGKVSLVDGFRKVVGEVEAGDELSRYPIAAQQPRPHSARVVKKAVIARVDSGLLDVFLTWDQSNPSDAIEISAEDNSDWMTRILQSEPFVRLPPSKLQGLLRKLQPFPVHGNDTILSQGDEGDYFYIIHEGRCAVTRTTADGRQELLAELGDGDSFGEEALVSENRRNATVTMLTDGLLMRLAKQDFAELLHSQLVRYVDIHVARQMVADGAVWVDVRTPDEYAQGSFEDSVNIPLSDLRGEIPELVFNASYVLCCDTGRRSDNAAFLLSQKGFDVCVLEGGLSSLSGNGPEEPDAAPEQETAGSAEQGSRETDSDHAALQEALQQSRDNEARLQEQLEKLRGELMESTGKLGEMYNSVKGHDEEKALLYEQYSALQEEHAELLDELRNRLESEQDRAAGLQANHERLQQEHRQLREQVEDGESDAEQRLTGLQQELSGARDRITALEGELRAATTAREQAQAGLEARDAQLEQLAAAGAAPGDALDGQLAELQEQLQAQTTEMEALNGEYNQVRAALEEMRQENSSLRDGRADIEQRLEQQAREYENFKASLEGTEQSRGAQQAAWDEEKAALVAQLEEQQEARYEELQLQAASRDEELGLLQLERDELNENIRQAAMERQALEQEIAALQGQISELVSSHEMQLDSSREQQERLRGELADRDTRLEQAALQLGQFEVEKGVLEQELELARKQQAELQEQAGANEQRARAAASELQDAVRRSHDELKRKNDNEKELQGQIDRLRKKLEQVTADYRSARSDAQDGLDNLREELHAERKARSEERAQMAARQRELKEQLASIASEHEVNITNHSGVIEEAVAAVRNEEHNRLQGVLEAQAATEEQVASLQQELKQAHDELAEYQRQEKDRRQSDIELMAEQNQQAEAAISQLQAQLGELTRERDSALEEQQQLREKMNVQHAELEAAREDASRRQEAAENPVELRRQLEETRKNVEVAVRLRGEAEAARERMEAERDRLLVQVENMLAGAIHAPQGARPLSPKPVAVPAPQPAVTPATDAGQQSTRSLPRWPVFAIVGLALLAIIVVGWSLLDEIVMMAGNPLAVVMPDAAGVAPGDEQVVTPGPLQAPPATDTAVSSTDAAVPDAPEASPGETVAPRTAVLGNFRDSLRGGGRGPLMVELAAGSFQMGSPGKSDNSEEVPRHTVNFEGFSVSSTEVTFEEYDRFARATGRRRPSDEKWGRGDQPVINVTWHDAEAYTQWLSKQTGKRYRLPSEAEWEYAARAGNSGIYWWTDLHEDIPANCFNCGSQWDGARPAPVGRFAANGFGLYDMAGNVQEWTADCYHDNYRGAPADGSAWVTFGCTQRSVRGGAWSSPLDSLRSARRAQLDQNTRLDNLGFRVVRDN